MNDQLLLEERLKAITSELCSSYPNINTCEPWERLYALESSLRGTNAACDDLHAVIEILREKCNMTKEELIEISLQQLYK